MSTRSVIIIILFPFFLVGFAFFYLKKGSHDFLQSAGYEYYVNSDQEGPLGNSVISSKVIEGDIRTKYTLIKGNPYPYVSLFFRKDSAELFDTKEYSMILDIETDQDLQLSIRIGLMVDGYTNKKIPGSYVFFEKNINLKKGQNSITMDLDEIVRIPSWWFINKPFTENEFPTVSRAKTEYIAIYDVAGHNLDKEKAISISQLKIIPSYTRYYLNGSYLLATYCLLIFTLNKFRSRKFSRILVPVDLSKWGGKGKDYPQLILEFIGQHFANPALKIGDIARELGLTENQVSQKLKERTGKTFKPYLNFIRIERGKKLLVESEIQISEVAYGVGYNSAHHFIRVFKELEGTVPGEFRARSGTK